MRAALLLVSIQAIAAADSGVPTWTHIKQTGRCKVELVPVDATELRTQMQDRLVVPATIQVAPLGDHVESIRSNQMLAPAHAPKTEGDARQLAREFLTTNADLLGIGFELGHLDLVATKPHQRGWAFTAPIRRTVVTAQSYELATRVDIELDARGRITFASVGTLLPRFTICDGPQLRKFNPLLLAHVVGATLADGIVVERADVVSIEAGVIALDELAYAVAYTIAIDHDHHRWKFVVDGDTGDIMSIQDLL